MKKNGKKYRKLQKEKELKKSGEGVKIKIDQEVNDLNIAFLAMSHIVGKNPIVYDDLSVKNEYLKMLKSLVGSGGWNRRKYEGAELNAYRTIILEEQSGIEVHPVSFYKYYILFDMFHVLGYSLKESDKERIGNLKSKYHLYFAESGYDANTVDSIIRAFKAPDERKIKKLLLNEMLSEERDYIQLIVKNREFQRKVPFGIMVTATMSAGKSTFINALVGKYVCLSQNMACTSKIHSVVNKAFEDSYIYEYDHELVLTASREELMDDNILNSSDKIVVGTKFIGGLSDARIIVNDSPGVNFSMDQNHKTIADNIIKGRNYNLLIYLMNATQLSTNDESEHLEFVKRVIGRTPVLFVINKIDAFDNAEESVIDAISRQNQILENKGFKNPMICPVSSRAGYLAKRSSMQKLSRAEQLELCGYIDKFESMKLCDYYAKAFNNVKIADSEKEEEQLLKTSGLAYVEKIIKILSEEGKGHGANLR